MAKSDKTFLKDFIRDIPRGIASRDFNLQHMPQARWLSPETILEAKMLTYDPAGPGRKILIGALGDKLVGIDDNRHILTIAGSRTGKSVTLIGNLLFYRGSVLAADPKAELANVTAERRAALGQKVCVLDPFKHASERVAKFRASYNPMSVLKPESPTIIEDAELITDALVIQPVEQKDPHWDESAKHFIEGLMLHVATDPRYEGKRHLVSVRELIKNAVTEADAPDDDTVPESALALEMLENAKRLSSSLDTEILGGAIEAAARDFYERNQKEQLSVLSTARRHTKFIDYTAMRSVLTGHDFDLADLKRNPKGLSVYLCLPASRMGLCNRWLRIFINQLLDAMEREKTVPDAPVLTCLDEFPVLGYMRQIEDAAGQIASFHVKLWVFLQDWSQGKSLYKDRWETFVGNAGIMQFFGNSDLTTTEYISKLLGKTPVTVSREGEVGPEQRQAGLTGRSDTTELYELMTTDEISQRFARQDRLKRQLVIWSGYEPMILQRVEYYDTASVLHRNFKGKYAPASDS